MPKNHDDERQKLVDHEQTPATTLDNDFGFDASAAGGFVADDPDHNFVPATLPHETREHFHNVDLPQILAATDAPTDRFNFTYIVFYLLGTATMTPWNFFITAQDYWMYKFRNATFNESDSILPELTPMQKSFTCDLTLTASISGTTFLILNAVYGQRVPLKLKMLGTLSIILIMFIITTAFVEVNTDHWQEQFFLITLFTVVILNISSATMSGGLFGIAGLFPSEYMTAMVSGQALGGIFTALAFILVLAFGAAPNTTAFIYFTIGSFLIMTCIVGYVLMSRQAFFKYYVDGDAGKYQIICAAPNRSRQAVVDAGIALEPNIREVFGKIYVVAVSICLLFATTLSVYPAVTALTQSEDYGNGKAWNNIYFMPVVNYLFFNCGDYLGRVLAGLWERPRKNLHTVLLMAFLRILYLPFFLCSNSIHHFLPVFVHTDVAFIVMIITFAVSNGYLANIILIMAPRSVMQHEKEMASSIMVASLSCGLAFGSMLSMVFVQLL